MYNIMYNIKELLSGKSFRRLLWSLTIKQIWFGWIIKFIDNIAVRFCKEVYEMVCVCKWDTYNLQHDESPTNLLGRQWLAILQAWWNKRRTHSHQIIINVLRYQSLGQFFPRCSLVKLKLRKECNLLEMSVG